MNKNPPLTSQTRTFWTEVYKRVSEKRYSHWAITGGERPQAPLVDDFYKPFCRVPCAPMNLAVWGFTSEVKRNEFLLRYTASEWSP